RGLAEAGRRAHPVRRAAGRPDRGWPRAPADRHRDHDPRGRGHRRAVRGDQGGARRVLPGRGEGPGRGAGVRQAVPGAERRRRGPSDHGHLGYVTCPPGGTVTDPATAPPSVDGAPVDGASVEGAASPDAVRAAVADAHRREWAYVLAATVRVASDLDLAEECVQEAYVAALDVWVREGIPDRPGAWLTTTARRRALDAHRRAATLRAKLPLLVEPDVEPGPGG